MGLRRSDRGFTLTHILIVLATIGLVIAAGYYIWTQRDDEPDEKSNSITSFGECVAAGNPVMDSYPEQCRANGQTFVNEAQEEKPADKTASWLLYTTPTGQSIRIADGLTLIKGDDEFLFTYSPEYKPGEKATASTPIEGGSDNPIGLFIDFQNRSDEYTPRGEKETLTTTSGLKVDKFTFTQTVDPDAIDIPKGTTEIVYMANKGGKYFRLTYAFTDSGPMLEQVEQMVKTLEIE